MKVIDNVFEVVESLVIGTCTKTRPLSCLAYRCTWRTSQLFHLVLFDLNTEFEVIKLNICSIVLRQRYVICKNLCFNQVAK